MSYRERVLQYNNEIKESLSLIYNELNAGQQKKLLKNDTIKSLLTKYKVIGDEE